jgi:2-hydroxychromene-2-carboxylate isomerase
MPRTVEFFFDYGSAFSYLADKRLPAIAARSERRWSIVQCCSARC